MSILAVVVTDKLSSLEKEKATDHLSGLLNRRGFGDAAARIFRLRPSGPIGILLLDIDHFKRINDRYGHHAGDLVIGGVARLIAEMTSSVDGVSCRLGGEEFAILLPDKDGQRSAMFAERIRSAIEQQKFDTGQRNLSVTVSVGVHARSHPASLQQLLDRADEALYRAKRHGRNRVEEL
ncbi:GGDEF domain-containing protein [Brucella daejeonensis]|uniref:GGDEF domain-containing protein n=1 Tax=Brucella daejeonensis TaxID=659015 RepID=UPI0035BC0834